MSSVLHLIGESFSVFRRNFVLVYPLLFFLLIISLLKPSEAGIPELDLKWILLLVSMSCLYFAFLSGWYTMVAEACRRWMERKSKPPQELTPQEVTAELLDPFTLFRQFLPGVGEYFGSFLLGGGIQVGAVLLIFGVAHLLIDQYIGVPVFLGELVNIKTEAEAQALINALSPEAQEQFGNFTLVILGSLLAYGVFYLLTMLWSPFVILHRVNALTAYRMSLVQWFRDPLRVLLIALWFFLLNSLLMMVPPAGPLLLILFQFLFMFLKTYFAVMLFLYVMQNCPAEVIPLKPEENGGEDPSTAHPS